MKHRDRLGFTLLELLIILVMTGLLVQLAVPNYIRWVEKSQAQSRQVVMLSLQTELESCYFHERDYRACVAGLGDTDVGEIETAASAHTYVLRVWAPDPRVACYRHETNEQHASAVYDAAGIQQEGCG